jgi:hypothetical protein
MKTSTKAILISIAIVMFPIVAVLAYLYLYIPNAYSPEKLQAKANAGYELGQEFGKTTNEQNCFAEARTRAKDRTLDALTGPPWLSGCLSASEMSDGFCDGIAPPSKGGFTEQQSAICAERKIGEYCLYFMPIVEQHCHR